MAKLIDCLFCPIKNLEIDIGLCQDIQCVADEAMNERLLDFKLSSQDIKTCKLCKKRIDPAL